MRFQAGVFRAPHDGSQEDGLEVAAVIGKMAMGLSERRNDLRHFQAKSAFCVRQRRPVALRIALVALGRVGPDLDALAGKRRPVAGAADGAAHPEAAAADPLHDCGAGAIIVGTAPHCTRWLQAFRNGGDGETGNSGHHQGAAGGEQSAAGEQVVRHSEFSYRACRGSTSGRPGATETEL